MENVKCPYCGIALSDSLNLSKFYIAHKGQVNNPHMNTDYYIYHYCCPDCDNIMVGFSGVGSNAKDITKIIIPDSTARQFPDYIPLQIRNDYTEAFDIQHLSPKASATLARRCLQGMIRDFFEVKPGKLNDEINQIQDKTDPSVWKVIHSVRQIGNIGAHMEQDINKIVDIDPDEAGKLIKLIEFLLEKWYINRHDAETLFDEINAINDEKQNERKN